MNHNVRLNSKENHLAFIAGGGEMGERTRAYDWSNTAIGPVAEWPQSLKIAVRIMLESRYAMWLGWGPDFTFFYNDAYARMTLGPKHPWALGRSAREVWSEIWHDIGPRAESVVRTGEATWDEGLLLFLERQGFPEETYHTFSYSPLPDDHGDVGGMLCVVTEDTERTIGERRLRTLRELAARTNEDAKSAEEACLTAVLTLAENQQDLPFVLIYLLDAQAKTARLAGATGLQEETSASPRYIDLASKESQKSSWPLRAVLESCRTEVVTDLGTRFGRMPGGVWPESTERAVVLPMAKPGQARLSGFVVAGTSPRLVFDDGYKGFMELLASQVATTVTNARAYEEERRRAESLAELDRAKTTFFSNVSHEFRTPLALMLGPVEDILASANGEFPAQSRELLEVVHRNALRMQKLVNMLLDFSRIEAGRVQACYEPVDLASLTAELASNFRSACQRAGLELVVNCPPLPEPVYVDVEMWEKIVLNLLSNAFKFTLEGRIEVALRKAERGVVELSVRDTGTGIPANQLPLLFERFHRVEGAKGRTQEGSGIGLALVRELARLNNGDVRVQSELGQGSVFTVTLLLGKAHLPDDRITASRTLASTALGASIYVEEAMRWLPDLQQSESFHKAHSNGERNGMETGCVKSVAAETRPRILLADDNADMRDYIRRLLAGRYAVTAVADGLAARDAVFGNTPDLLLSDVMMPGLDGFGLLKALRADPRTQGLPIILLSARAGEEARVEGLKASADDYLTKPFSAKELLARIDSALEIARLRREALIQQRQLLGEVEEQRNWLRVTLSSIGDAVIATDNAGRVSFLNPVAEMLTGWPQDEARGRSLEEIFVITNEITARPVENPVSKVLHEGRIIGLANHTVLTAKDGTKRPIDDSAAPIRNADGATQGVVLIFRDVTEQKRSEAVLTGQKRVLEQIVQGVSLPDILDALCEIIEGQSPDKIIATVLLLDKERSHLRSVAGRRMPGAYAHAVDGVKIGPCVGSCGTAAYRGESVVVSDIAADPLWTNFRDTALGHGLRACWSTPILSSRGKVLGTFAVYYFRPHHPSGNEFQLVDILTRTAAIAIERLQAEEALREAHTTLRSFYDTSPVMMGVVEVDADKDDILHLTDNAATGRFWGVNPAYLSRRRASELGVPAPILQEWVRHYRESGSMGSPIRFEYPHAISGNTRWLSAIVCCIERLPDGRTRCSYVAEDVTERKQVEETLRKQSERLRLLWEAATVLLTTDNPDAMLRTLFDKIAPHFALDTYFNFLVNESGDGLYLCSCTGIPEDEARKINRLEFGQAVCGTVALRKQPIAATYIQASDEPMVQLVKRYGVRAYACNPLLVDGQLLGTLSFASRSRDTFDADDLEFLGTICRYVTVAYQRLRLVQQLRDQDRRKDEFLATLAHELRNPLAPIRNSLQILKIPRLDTTTLERSREMMERQVHQLVRLVDDLLDVSRVMRGKIELRKEKIELAAVAARAVETVQPLIEAQGHELTVNLPSESLPLDADPIRLAQVIGNLLTNAAKYTEPNGRIWLTAQREGHVAVLSVRDSGIGIAPDMLPHIFELFVQVDHAATRSQGGLGIGLTLVKNLVGMHHGTVEAHSAGLGRGSEFVVRLPLMLQEYGNGIEDVKDEQQPEFAHSARHRLLVVDDNRDAAESLAMLLRLYGHEVRVANDGFTALEIVKEYTPALVFLDIGMPTMDGYEVARRLRQQSSLKNVRLAALTGWGQQEDRRRTAEAGFDHHLVKPPEPAVLESLLANLEISRN